MSLCVELVMLPQCWTESFQMPVIIFSEKMGKRQESDALTIHLTQHWPRLWANTDIKIPPFKRAHNFSTRQSRSSTGIQNKTFLTLLLIPSKKAGGQLHIGQYLHIRQSKLWKSVNNSGKTLRGSTNPGFSPSLCRMQISPDWSAICQRWWWCFDGNFVQRIFITQPLMILWRPTRSHMH